MDKVSSSKKRLLGNAIKEYSKHLSENTSIFAITRGVWKRKKPSKK